MSQITKTEGIFPEIFITGKLPEGFTKKSLIADGLVGWALCETGNTPPENFGKAMILIGEYTGDATPDGLMRLANKITK